MVAPCELGPAMRSHTRHLTPNTFQELDEAKGSMTEEEYSQARERIVTNF